MITVCSGKKTPYHSYSLYGPDSYFDILDLDKINPTTNKNSKHWLNLTNSRFGQIYGTLDGGRCLSEEQMPSDYKCFKGKFFGLNAELDMGLTQDELNEINEINDAELLDGMSFVTIPNTMMEKKYKIVKSCDIANKLYFKMCEHQIYGKV